MLPERIAQPVKSFVRTYNPMRLTSLSAPSPVIHTPKVGIEITRGHLTAKIATTRAEIAAVFRLRQHVFQREFKNRMFSLQSDRERYDDFADFLIITDNRFNKIVGTYRLISTQHSEVLYSATEFNLSNFLETNEPKLELSRACIHRSYRTGAVMALLWRGVALYGQKLGARYLFGCASVKTTDVRAVARIYKSLEAAGKVDHSYGIHPIGKYRMDGLEQAIETYMSGMDNSEQDVITADLPPLFKSYLKAGAMVHGLPAVDWDFSCIDALTILDFAKMSATHERKFVRQ